MFKYSRELCLIIKLYNVLRILHLAPNVDYISFVEEGWKQEKYDKSLVNPVLDAKYIELYPEIVSNLLSIKYY